MGQYGIINQYNEWHSNNTLTDGLKKLGYRFATEDEMNKYGNLE